MSRRLCCCCSVVSGAHQWYSHRTIIQIVLLTTWQVEVRTSDLITCSFMTAVNEWSMCTCMWTSVAQFILTFRFYVLCSSVAGGNFKSTRIYLNSLLRSVIVSVYEVFIQHVILCIAHLSANVPVCHDWQVRHVDVTFNFSVGWHYLQASTEPIGSVHGSYHWLRHVVRCMFESILWLTSRASQFVVSCWRRYKSISAK